MVEGTLNHVPSPAALSFKSLWTLPAPSVAKHSLLLRALASLLSCVPGLPRAAMQPVLGLLRQETERRGCRLGMIS